MTNFMHHVHQNNILAAGCITVKRAWLCSHHIDVPLALSSARLICVPLGFSGHKERVCNFVHIITMSILGVIRIRSASEWYWYQLAVSLRSHLRDVPLVVRITRMRFWLSLHHSASLTDRIRGRSHQNLFFSCFRLLFPPKRCAFGFCPHHTDASLTRFASK